MVVSFDTMVLIWGVKQVATPGQEEMIGRATRLIDELRASNTRIVLPTPVVAEYVGSFQPDAQAEQFKAVRENFATCPFDLRASAIAAGLLYNQELVKQLKDEYACSRQVIKTDMMIVASAISAGCGVLYSNDGKVLKAAQGKILVKPIPELSSHRSAKNIAAQEKDLFPESGETE